MRFTNQNLIQALSTNISIPLFNSNFWNKNFTKHNYLFEMENFQIQKFENFPFDL